MHKLLIGFLVVAWGMAPGLGWCAETSPAGETAEAAAPAATKKIVQFPFVNVDREKREVRVEAELSPGLRGMFAPLEFMLICGNQDPKTGKWFYDRDYESVFVTKADPNILHAALMLIGLQPGGLESDAPEGYVKDNAERIAGEREAAETKADQAPRVDIFVEWEQDGKTVSIKAEKFLFDKETDKPVADTPWAFTGSYFVTNAKGEKTLAARQTYVVVAVFADESAVLNLPFYAKNAYWGDDAGFEVNAAHLPEYFRKEKEIVEGTKTRVIAVPVHHPVTLIFRPAAETPPVEGKPAASERANTPAE